MVSTVFSNGNAYTPCGPYMFRSFQSFQNGHKLILVQIFRDENLELLSLISLDLALGLVGLYGHGNGIVSFRFKDDITHHYIPTEFMHNRSPGDGFNKWIKTEYNVECTNALDYYIRVKFNTEEDLTLFLLRYS